MELTKMKSARLCGTIKISNLWIRWWNMSAQLWFSDLLGSPRTMPILSSKIYHIEAEGAEVGMRCLAFD